MSQYILRLDDASDYMNIENWQRMEKLLDKYNIKPLVGVIPENKDPMMVGVYEQDHFFWDRVKHWQEKGWEIALHGCNHEYITDNGGMNPVNKRSEFAGVSLEKQCKKIRTGVRIFREHGIEPQVFFAPSHTFDENTLNALKKESDIRIISDTIASDVYFQDGFYFVPQQSGRVRKLPFRVCTFCYHPNMMKDSDFQNLELYLEEKYIDFVSVRNLTEKNRSISAFDKILRAIYFAKRQ